MNSVKMVVVTLVVTLGIASPLLAQDAAITNARIIVGNGTVIDQGTIIVRDGEIVSVTSGEAPTQGLPVIDAAGMTAMPGFIDGHKHIRDSEQFAAQMMSLLEAGYTTILNGGGQAAGNLELSNRISNGAIVGPRLIPSGGVSVRQTPAEARAAVREMAAMGVMHTGEIGLTPEPAPPQSEIETLKAIVEEAAMAGVQVNVHAVSSTAMEAAVQAGVRRLVHLPNKDWTNFEQAQTVADAGAIVSGLIAFGAPTIERESSGFGSGSVPARQHDALP